MAGTIYSGSQSPTSQNPVWEVGLSLVSTQGLWILFQRLSGETLKLADSLKWTDPQTSRISGIAGNQLTEILTRNHLQTKDLSCLWGISGPGTFTGIRVTGSLLLGLSKALRIPLAGVHTFCLANKPFGIPLQSMRQRGLTHNEIVNSGTPVIFLNSETQVEIRPLKTQELFWGGAEKPDWPSETEFLESIKRLGSNRPTFKPNYGYNPEFSI